MGIQEDRYKAMLRQKPEYIPVGLGVLPAAWIKYREALEEIALDYPLLFGDTKKGERDFDLVGGTYVMGDHTDVWGCVWENIHQGQESIVTRHPVPRREDIASVAIPEKDAGFPHGFMYLRLQDLRGFDELMLDIAEEAPELDVLIEKVTAYNERQAGILLKNAQEPGTLFYFGDDLGMQKSLPMSPGHWRRYLKPAFRRIYAPLKEAGHYVYMHTDGHILEIIPDLMDVGVDVVNPQIGANGLENLRAVCQEGERRICINLDLDRQKFPFFSSSEIDEHVHEAVEVLGDPQGGLWLSAEVDDGVPLENVRAICNALMKYRAYYR